MSWGVNMLTNSLKISDTIKTQFFELIFFQSVKKNMRKIVSCWVKESLEPINIFTVHKCSDTGFFRHLSDPVFSV